LFKQEKNNTFKLVLNKHISTQTRSSLRRDIIYLYSAFKKKNTKIKTVLLDWQKELKELLANVYSKNISCIAFP